jgi:hypothetical protein
VIRVGDGRGFVLTDPIADRRIVVTAAHCLPSFPPSFAASYLKNHTYQQILGPLDGRRTVWAECLFVDPIADLAVLGTPDSQASSKRSNAYDKLIYADRVHPFEIGAVPAPAPRLRKMFKTDKDGRITAIRPFKPTDVPKPKPPSKAWLLSLKNEWFQCNVSYRDGPLLISNAVDGIRGGMSGSPIVDDAGRAVGVISTSGGIIAPGGRGIGAITEGPMNPNLVLDLPGSDAPPGYAHDIACR